MIQAALDFERRDGMQAALAHAERKREGVIVATDETRRRANGSLATVYRSLLK